MSGRVAAIIPARLGSTRLPNKPLLRDTGKFLIQHVVERVRMTTRLDPIVVATDDRSILSAVESFGGRAVMTSIDHQSGTDRVAEVARGLDVDAVLNVQGDEPEIDPRELDRLADAVLEPGAEIVTLAAPIHDEATYLNQNAVKVVIGERGRALYFSRRPIPWTADPNAALTAGLVRKHVGVYAYSKSTLLRFTQLAPVDLERSERLEQLRALHHGITIRVLDTPVDSAGIDTPDDYAKFVARVARWKSGKETR